MCKKKTSNEACPKAAGLNQPINGPKMKQQAQRATCVVCTQLFSQCHLAIYLQCKCWNTTLLLVASTLMILLCKLQHSKKADISNKLHRIYQLGAEGWDGLPMLQMLPYHQVLLQWWLHQMASQYSSSAELHLVMGTIPYYVVT
jgi:hypothetical protein